MGAHDGGIGHLHCVRREIARRQGFEENVPKPGAPKEGTADTPSPIFAQFVRRIAPGNAGAPD
jgi:hypothetical protein